MANLRGNKDTAVAVFVDGQEVKLAKLSLKRGRAVVEELRSATLASRLEERQSVEAGAEAGGGGESEFGGGASALPETAAGGEDNNAVLLGLLSGYPTAKYAFAYSIAEPSLYYHPVEGAAGLKGKRLKTRIAEEIKATRAAAPSLDAVDYFPSADGGMTAVIREDGLGVSRMLEGIRPFLGNRVPLFTLIDSADLVLMGLARANYGFEPEEITVLVYVGVEFSRLIFLKGSDFFHFAPVVGEGYDAANIQNTIYSRLLLEQDSIGIPRLDRVLIAGEAKRLNFDEFLKEQLPEVEIQYIQTPYLDVSRLPAEVQDQVPGYAIPIATAWKVLQQQHTAFYPINLLPREVREGQRAFKLAWHGYLLFAAIFLSTFFFTIRVTQQREMITSQEADLASKVTQAKGNDELRAQIANLNKQLEGFKTALTVYNTIVPGYDRWNKVIAKMASGFSDINSVWITDMSANETGLMTFNGYTLYKARVPQAAKIFEGSTLKSVEVLEIRDKTVYRFKVDVQLPMGKK